MNDFLKWIDQDVDKLKDDNLYLFYFKNSQLNEENEDVYYISNYEKGIELVLSKFKKIETIHFFGEERNNEKMFIEELPLNINFFLSKSQINNIFGKPQKNGGGHTSILIGFMNKWEKYYFPSYSLRFEYSNNEKTIVLLTIASLSLESDFNSAFQ